MGQRIGRGRLASPATTPVFAPGLAEDEPSPDVPPGTVPGLFCSLPPGAGVGADSRTTSALSPASTLTTSPAWFSVTLEVNAAARFAAAREDTDIVTGVSLAMLIEVLGKRRGSADVAKLVATAKKAGAAGVRVFSEVYTKPTATVAEDDEGDEL